jgi:phage shock protein C
MSLKRSSTNSVVCGVCGGIAESIGTDPMWIRLAFVVATLMGLGSPILIYLVLALLMPKA